MYQQSEKLPFTRCGADGKLKLDQAVALMMDCCHFQELQEAEFKKFLTDHHLVIFLHSLQIDILRMPELNETIRTAVKIYGAKSIYGLRRFTIRDENDKICLIGNGTGAFFDLQAQKAVKYDPSLFPVKFDEAEEMEVLPRKIPLPDSPAVMADRVTIRPSWLDPNGHLTSSEFIALASDMLKADFSFNRVRIEYKRQAKPGESIRCMVQYADDGRAVVDLKNSEALSCAVVEFSTASGQSNS
ncbi:MAG: hypothetical protein IJW33_01315 [Lentisphaeria bacterium]|nr:hypothetical protein [Lentisphaeria bacterium]